jgi:A/G-specific adenine glycosylase
MNDMQQELETGLSHGFEGSDPADRESFVRLIKDYYRAGRRPMPWRDHITPYRVVVSEIMLQQTRVSRVMEKFPEFIRQFPDFPSLHSASLGEVLAAWQGLGYNRRARYLHGIAIRVMEDWNGILPSSPDILQTLPGIGAATAGSITAFAFNTPVVFIETNIRRVFIHHFFADESQVADSRILPIIADTLDTDNPRDWYYALMDYGTWLSGRIENPNRRSRHYSRQPSFEGSDRQIRGEILRQLINETETDPESLIRNCSAEMSRGLRIIARLIEEGLLIEKDGIIRIAER